MFIKKIGYLPNKTGFCQIGSFDDFKLKNIHYGRLFAINIDEPITQWFPLLKNSE